MEAIKILIEEHRQLERMLTIVRKLTYDFMEGNSDSYDIEDYNLIIDFIKNYSDAHHHKKEEEVLFSKMQEAVETKGKNFAAVLGMYIEHDNAKLYTLDLEVALDKYKSGDPMAKLDIIANAISYTNLLARHIDKENKAIYIFAENILSSEDKLVIDKEILLIEKKAKESKLQEKYLSMLESLEAKYL